MRPSHVASVMFSRVRAVLRTLFQLIKNLWTVIVFTLLVLVVAGFGLDFVFAQGDSIWSHMKTYADYVGFAYRHPMVGALSALLLGIYWGLAGTGLGLQNLFWPDHPSRRVYASLFLTLYFALIGTLAHFEGHLLSRSSPSATSPPAPTDSTSSTSAPSSPPLDQPDLRDYLFRTGIPLIALILLPAAVPGPFRKLPRVIEAPSARRARMAQSHSHPFERLRAWLAFFLPTFLGVLLAILSILGILWASSLFNQLIRHDHSQSPDAHASLLHRLLDLLSSDGYISHLFRFYILFAVTFFVGLAGLFYRAVTPAIAICSLFSLAAMSLTLPEFLLHITRNPSFGEEHIFFILCEVLIGLLFLVLPLLVLVALFFRAIFRIALHKITDRPADGPTPGRLSQELVPVLSMFALTILLILVGSYLLENIQDWLKPHYRELFFLLFWGILLIWVIFANSDPFKLRFPNMAMYYPGGRLKPVDLRAHINTLRASHDTPDPPADAPPPPRSTDDPIDNQQCLSNWLAHVRECRVDRQEPLDGWKPKLAIVTVSGGALRSAYWTSVVLNRIRAEIPGFGSHVRLIAGASGGMVGAAYFVGDLRAEQDPDLPPMPHLPVSSIDAVARYIALREVFKALVPASLLNDFHNLLKTPRSDRGIRLEQDWKGIDVPLRDYESCERAGKIPSLVFSPMIVESGRRLLISNLDMSMATCTRGSEICHHDHFHEVPYSISAVEFRRLFPQARDFHLSTAVRMSATFPFISPAVNLPTSPPARVVDAGYFDNYGVHCASSWLLEHVQWLAHHTSGVVLIQVRDSLSHQDRLGVIDNPQGLGARFSRGIQMLTSPVHAVAKAREASTSFRNDHDVMVLSRAFAYLMSQRLENPREFFTSVTFENSASVSFRPRSPGQWPGDGLNSPRRERSSTDVSLNWYLSEAERQGLDSAIPDPLPSSRWQDRANRLERVDELARKAESASGLDRLSLYKELEQALNYERLVGLKTWWDNTPKPRSATPLDDSPNGSVPPVALPDALRPLSHSSA